MENGSSFYPKIHSPMTDAKRFGCFAGCHWNFIVLDVFEALAEKLCITAVQTDLVLGDASRFEADCVANDKRDGFSFGFANALRRAAPAPVAMHHLVRDFMRQSCKPLSRSVGRH